MLSKALIKNNKYITGIIQVGAHIGQQVDIFLESTDKNIYLFEPQKNAYNSLRKYESYPNIFCFNFGLGNKNGIETIHVSDVKQGVSSSLLTPKLHSEFFPEYTFTNKEEIMIKKFSSLENTKANFLVIDVQGYELEVLKGFSDKLVNIDYIFSEVNLVEFYEKSVLIDQLDSYLYDNDFIRTKTSIFSNVPMGDALYVRKSKLKNFQISYYKIKSKLKISKIFLFINHLKNPKKLFFHLKNKIGKKIKQNIKIYEILINVRSFLRFFYNTKTRNRIIWSFKNGDDTISLDYPLNENSIVFDIGAYHGSFTEKIFKKFNCNIYAFEPILENSDKIRSKFKHNNKIKIYDFGLIDSDRDEKISNIGLGSSIFPRDEGIPDNFIKLVSFEKFIQQNSIQKIDLVYVNIEGSEYDLMRHIIDSGNIKKIKFLQIQFHNFIENSTLRRMQIRNDLKKTHKPIFNYSFTWEGWALK